MVGGMVFPVLQFRESIMSQGKASAAFKMMVQKMPGYEQAKQAEANLNNVPVPLGWEGLCKAVDMIASVSGNDNAYIKFYLLPVNDEKYGSKPIEKLYTIKEKSYQGATTSADEVYTKFLNDMERAGLPREVRTGGDIDDIIAWWLDPDEDRLVYVSYNKIDKNDPNSIGYVSLSRPRGGSVDTSSNLVPGLPKENKTPVTKTTSSSPEVGSKVMYMDRECDVVADLGEGKIRIKTQSGKERDVEVKDLD